MQIASSDAEQQSLSVSARQHYSAELIDHLLNEIKEYAIFMVDTLGVIVTWNPGVKRLLGYCEEEFIGQPFALIFVGQDQLDVAPKSELETAKSTGRAEDQRWHQKKDGSRFWANGLVTATKDSEDKVTGFVKIMRDQTLQKELELQIADYDKRLSATNQQLLRFAGVVSHDLKSPLQSVRGFASIVQEKTKAENLEVKESIEHIMDSADRMLSLVNELLHFSKDSDGPIVLESVNSEQIFANVLEGLNSAIAKSQAVITHDKLPVVQASAVQLGRIFQNLIENALKFTRTGSAPVVHVSAEHRDNKIIFRVADNGTGIEDSRLKRLFIMFERLEPESHIPGFGIGLASTKRVVELLGGTLSVESKLGNGSTFIFSLPNLAIGTSDPELFTVASKGI